MVNAGRVAIVPKGEFVFGTQYTRLDMVKYNGGVYVAIKDNVGTYPTDKEKWMFMLSEGEVISVNGQTGAVYLTAEDVGAVSADNVKIPVDPETEPTEIGAIWITTK